MGEEVDLRRFFSLVSNASRPRQHCLESHEDAQTRRSEPPGTKLGWRNHRLKEAPAFLHPQLWLRAGFGHRSQGHQLFDECGRASARGVRACPSQCASL